MEEKESKREADGKREESETKKDDASGAKSDVD